MLVRSVVEDGLAELIELEDAHNIYCRPKPLMES